MKYRRAICAIYWGIVKAALRKRFLGRGIVRRNETHVKDEYAKVWADTRRAVRGRGSRLQTLYGRPVVCRSIDHRKFFLRHMADTLSSIQPHALLEMGSGNGFNLLAIGVMRPDIATLRGVELTDAGVAAFEAFLKNPPIEDLMYVTGESEKTIRERLRGRDIRCVKGDMLALPFGEESFDCVFTCWALEQLPRAYPSAFAEARRVSRRYAMFYEAFSEAQENIFQMLHLKNLDYFRAPIADVKKAGFEILRFEPMGLSKIKFTSGALLAEKN